ncbi:MAG: tetratricopeptide repeat protein [Flavobacteriales bacterium]|nr:tetratricopeptide repeat protein [Flavobacteriales bacterium]
MKKWLVLASMTTAVVILAARCSGGGSADEKENLGLRPDEQHPTYKNLADTVAYVGKQVCKACHGDIYDTYVHTGMGLSFDKASRVKSSSKLGPDSKIYDEYRDFWYHPFWKGEELKVLEYRLHGLDTTYKRIESVDYIIGSGQHTNSHIYNVNGYLHQVPFTYYTQSGKLDFPPGFENGNNTRFSRTIGLECMSCHNSLPEFVLGSENKFNGVPDGISCERCHGPGQIHVIEKGQGIVVDTSKFIDYSIVNPAKLEGDLQFEVCQRCHLQGNAVLKPGKDWYDFKPGMRLSEVMSVFLPRYEGGEDEFIMASHVDRFKQSKCYLGAEETFNCISCHNPHKSVRETNIQQFNATCGDCHGETPMFGCRAPQEDVAADDFNCVACHMPSSTSIDIPHVTVHDHKIRVPELDMAGEENIAPQAQKIRKFMGLVSVNEGSPNDRTKARSYLQQYEKFTAYPQFLDSAKVFIDRAGEPLYEVVNWHFLSEDFDGLCDYIDQRGRANALDALRSTDFTNNDAWTAYRIGQSYRNIGRNEEAFDFLSRAISLAPYQLEFRNKIATLMMDMGLREKALSQLEFVYKEYPYYPENLNNLGFYWLREGDLERAAKLYDEAIALDPDYVPGLLNRAGLALYQERWADAERDLVHILRIEPNHPRANQVYEQLKQVYP